MEIVKWLFKDEIYNTKREISEKFKYSGSVMRAKIKDKEIIKIFTHTGTETYEKKNNWENSRDFKS